MLVLTVRAHLQWITCFISLKKNIIKTIELILTFINNVTFKETMTTFSDFTVYSKSVQYIWSNKILIKCKWELLPITNQIIQRLTNTIVWFISNSWCSFAFESVATPTCNQRKRALFCYTVMQWAYNCLTFSYNLLL